MKSFITLASLNIPENLQGKTRRLKFLDEIEKLAESLKDDLESINSAAIIQPFYFPKMFIAMNLESESRSRIQMFFTRGIAPEHERDGIEMLTYFILRSTDCNTSRLYFIDALNKIFEVINIVRRKTENLESNASLATSFAEAIESIFTPIPNHVMKIMTKQQKGNIGDIKDKDDKKLFVNILENTINKNPNISDNEKSYELEKIKTESNNYEVSQYLGFTINIHEIVIVRAILIIVSKLIELGKIKDTDKMIYIQWRDIYEECSIPKGISGNYESRLTKPIRELILKKGQGNLTKQQWLKDEFSGRIIRSQFLLEVEPKGTKVGLHLSSFLFFDKQKLAKCTMMDNKGFARFRKINRTTIGINLFLYLERYMSQKDEIKILDLNTIIRMFSLNTSYEKNKKRTLEEIEKAFKDMVNQKTILKSWQRQKGVNGQLQYEFKNLNYKPREIQQEENRYN
jgi:hypothetical protein